MTPTKPEYDPNIVTCDYCDKPAVANFQKLWTKFRVSKDGDYRKLNNWSDKSDYIDEDDNVHVCREHETQWENGDLT